MGDTVTIDIGSLRAAEIQAGQQMLAQLDANATGATLPPPPAPSRKRNALSWSFFIGMAVLMFFYLQSTTNQRFSAGSASPTSPSLTPAPTPWFQRPHIILLVGGYTGVVLTFAILVQRMRGATDPHRVVVDARGVDRQSDTTAVLWKWAAFRAVAETDDLFVLHLGSLNGVILPKRAIAPDEIGHLRDLLNQHASMPLLSQHKGFEVLP